jgi:cytidylate kinase
MSKHIITIERMVACGGLYIGRRVAESLHIPCLDQEILSLAAKELQQDEKQLTTRDERLLSFGQKLLATFGLGSPEAEYVPPPFPFPEDNELFAAEKTVILGALKDSGAVIVGHGGGSILKDFSSAVRVFCHAPLAFRIQRLMDLYNFTDEAEARRAVEDQDRARERYLKAVTGRNWKDVDQYDLCIDTSSVGIEQAAKLIITLSKQKNGNDVEKP